MVLDGGVRVPFLMAWPGTVPAGQVYEPMVSSLDVTPTVLAAVEAPIPTELDGVNLLPYLRDAKGGEPHAALYWRWRGQAAIRKGPWKFVSFGREREYLFQVNGPEREQQDRLADEPELAQQLRDELKTWCGDLSPPGLPADINPEDREFFRNHLRKARHKAASPST
jgi:uncharacterized sulfatase